MAGDQHREQEARTVAEEHNPEVQTPLEEDAAVWSSWGNLWQVPAIVISGALIIAAIFVAVDKTPQHDFDGALAQLEQALRASPLTNEQLQMISSHLRDTIQPRISEATSLQQGRYHRLIADWFAVASQFGAVNREQQAPQHMDEHYKRAVELGSVLEPLQVERWAGAQLQLGNVTGAKQRLDELDARDLRDSADGAVRPIRNRVFRSIIEYTLRRGDLNDEATLSLLTEFRADARLSYTDRAWAMARQAELRITRGESQAAVDQLLVDVRRLEEAPSGDLAGDALGELYLLMARGYADLNRTDDAAFFLDRADKTLSPSTVVRGEWLLEQARLAVGRMELESAEQLATGAIERYGDSHVLPQALLLRAEVRAQIGQHDGSREDYQALRSRLSSARNSRTLPIQRVVLSLIDRHDAALTTGSLEQALQYIKLTESFYESRDVPIDVLSRLAATHRQIADNMIAAGEIRTGISESDLTEVPAAVRYEAARHYGHAATFFVRHARSIAGLPNEEELWARSLWLAGECEDFAGRPDRAVELFKEYLGSRPEDDPQRPEVLHRMAQAQQSLLDYHQAAQAYSQLIDEHPRTPLATRSHVPLAECLVVLGRHDDAVRRLEAVLAGAHPITPEASDYRDALLALGKIRYEAGEHVQAIQVLQQAVDRYPDQPQITTAMFMLGDAHRRRAIELEQMLQGDTMLAPTARAAKRSEVEQSLRDASGAFEAVLRRFVSGSGTKQEADQARTALLYRADCAYRLANYVQAIALFDQYARHYGDHHSSLTALIQIVNCYEALGQTQQASRAHDRAVFRLSRLPDKAFAEPDALMDRAAWERWLQNRPVGLQASATTSGGT